MSDAQLEAEAEQDEVFDLQEENEGITDTEDGGAIIEMEEQAVVAEAREHFHNLAEDMPELELSQLSIELIELIEQDKKSREQRDAIYAEGIKRTGLGDEAPGGADFVGASKAVHPLLTEVCVDFSARVMKELFPAAGPVKQHIPGTPTKEKVEKSRRKTKHMNWQFTKQIKEFRSELEQTLTQVPLGGAAYIKMSFDERHKRPASEFIAIDDIYYPFAASSFLSAERKTHARKITELKYKRAVKSGIYRDIDLATAVDIEETKSQTATDKIEGKTKDTENKDGLRLIYETMAFLNLEDEDEFDPYIVTIDQSSQKVMSIYRNWDAEDENKEEIQHIVEFPFVPWRGAAPIGITHMIGSLSGAATGALRALLDSAHINTVPTGFKLGGGVKGGQQVQAKATEIKEITGAINTDDIRKLFMPLPFNPPSPVLYELLGFLIKEGRGVVQTTFEGIADQKTDMPVGTTLALIEQGMTVFSAIHARLHNSMAQIFAIVHRLNAKHITTQEIKDDVGEVLARARDYQGPIDVIPVSDPNIFSEVQRQAQIALIAQRASLPFNVQSNMYNLRKVEKLILDYAKIPAPEELLNPAKEPMKDNAVNENVKATMNNALIAYPEQDHEAHITTHLDYMLHPIFGSSPLIAPTFIPTMVAHLRDHITYWYLNQVVEEATAVAGMDISDLMDPDDDVSKAFDQAMAVASANILGEVQNNPTLSKLPPVIQKAMEFVQQNQQPAPMDPSIVASKEVERKTAADAQTLQFKQMELQHKQQREQLEDQQKQQLAQMDQAHKAEVLKRQDARLQLDTQVAASKEKSDAFKLQDDSQAKQVDAATKMQLSAAEIAADQQNTQAKLIADSQQTEAQLAADAEVSAADNAVKLAINTADNDTAMRIAAAEITSGEKVAVSTGGGINP